MGAAYRGRDGADAEDRADDTDAANRSRIIVIAIAIHTNDTVLEMLLVPVVPVPIPLVPLVVVWLLGRIILRCALPGLFFKVV